MLFEDFCRITSNDNDSNLIIKQNVNVSNTNPLYPIRKERVIFYAYVN